MVTKEFFKQLEILSFEKKMDYKELIEIFKKALATSAKKICPPNTSIRVQINEARCEIRLFTQHEVVSELTEVQEDEMSQILLEDA
ncbi:MAG: NusA N-terminal domain-containing protein, partial [Cetobacterium sp.]